MLIRVSVDASEVNALGRDIQANATKVIPEVRTVVARTGYQVVGTAQVNAPFEFGTLRASIGVDIDGLSFEAGPTVDYGGFVEEGTTGPYPIENAFGWGITVMHPGISPQPYMGPAFDQHLPGAIEDIADIGERILR